MRVFIAVLMMTTGAAAAEDPHAQHQMPDAADRIYGADAMTAARHQLHHEHGAHVFSKVMVDALEYAAVRGQDAYHWEGEAWIGGDLNRAVFKTEGEGVFSGGVEHAEAQALYSRAIGPYFDLQAGLRHDFDPSRTYAALGVEGLAPYWFEVEAATFLSDNGDVLARASASYDQLITQRLVIQPKVEMNLAAQDVRASGIGAGLSDVEMGLRLRYEIRREFAPYVGVTYSRKVGATADMARAAGDGAGETAFMFGIRAWF